MASISRRAASLALAVCLALGALVGPAAGEAFAYFDRGSVGVSLGSSSVEVAAGQTLSVSVSIDPASDEQLKGCGMPKCPQDCAASCMDANGQCQCGGKDYATYYATAVASSSAANVAVATYNEGTLTVYGKAGGEADITVRASLRQFTDSEATLHVVVTGTAEGAAASSAAFADIPDAAQPETGLEDKVSFLEEQSMGRTIHMVRIDSDEDASARLRELAGIDGDTTFWTGDSYYQPEYSLTFLGSDYATIDVPEGFDPTLAVSTEATGDMTQPLDGVSDFLVVGFAQTGRLFAPATVYAKAAGVFDDGATVALFSWDSAAKAFVREDAAVRVTGGYVNFTATEGKTYVVSSRDLTTEAKAIVTDAATVQSDGCCVETEDAGVGQTLPTGAIIAIAALVIVIIALIAVIVRLMRKPHGAASPAAAAAKAKEAAAKKEDGHDD